VLMCSSCSRSPKCTYGSSLILVSCTSCSALPSLRWYLQQVVVLDQGRVLLPLHCVIACLNSIACYSCDTGQTALES
jgi:hypothetical protein